MIVALVAGLRRCLSTLRRYLSALRRYLSALRRYLTALRRRLSALRRYLSALRRRLSVLGAELRNVLGRRRVDLVEALERRVDDVDVGLLHLILEDLLQRVCVRHLVLLFDLLTVAFERRRARLGPVADLQNDPTAADLDRIADVADGKTLRHFLDLGCADLLDRHRRSLAALLAGAGDGVAARQIGEARIARLKLLQDLLGFLLAGDDDLAQRHRSRLAEAFLVLLEECSKLLLSGIDALQRELARQYHEAHFVEPLFFGQVIRGQELLELLLGAVLRPGFLDGLGEVLFGDLYAAILGGPLEQLPVDHAPQDLFAERLDEALIDFLLGYLHAADGCHRRRPTARDRKDHCNGKADQYK